MKTRTQRTLGFIVHIGESRSAGFWAVIKARNDGKLHFAYGRNFMSYPDIAPRVGWSVEFTPLPPAGSGPLQRATEIQIQRSTRGGQIEIGHGAGATATEIGGQGAPDRRDSDLNRDNPCK